MMSKVWATYFMDPQSPWGALLTLKNFLGAIPEELKKYFDFIEVWLSVAFTHEDKKRDKV